MVFKKPLFLLFLWAPLFGVTLASANDPASLVDNRLATSEPVIQELVDPTRPVAFVGPVGRPKETANQPKLQAIYLGENRREAVINGRTVKVGDVVDQVKILAIAPGRVRYIKNGKEGELVLLPRVLQPAQGED